MENSIDQLVITPKKTIQINQKKSKIILQNNSLSGYAFKVRTTCPDSYSVKPNIGIIKPLDTVKIIVTVQDEEKIQTEQKITDKFNLLVYEYDHKKTVDDLKKHLRDVKPEPIVSRILFVEHEKASSELNKTETEKIGIYVLTLVVILWVFPSMVRNFLFL